MKITHLIVFIFFIVSNQCLPQNSKLSIPRKIDYAGIYTVTPEDVYNIAAHSEKDITVFYTFAAWCSPCCKDVPETVKMSKDLNVDLFFLLVDRETNRFDIDRALLFLNKNSVKKDNIVAISDSLYSSKRRETGFKIIEVKGKKEREKYVNFLEQITPPQFKSTDGMGKHIILNKNSEVIYITTYKDSKGEEDANNKLQKVMDVINSERKK